MHDGLGFGVGLEGEVVKFHRIGGVELYDHAADPMEFKNLALKPDAEAKAVMQRLRKLLEKKASGKVPTTPFNPKRL